MAYRPELGVTPHVGNALTRQDLEMSVGGHLEGGIVVIESGWLFGGLALAAAGVLGASVPRVVWAHQRLVVFRFGQLRAVWGPGLAVVLPGAERGIRVSLQPERLDVLWLDVLTADGMAVTLNATALARVRDPAAYARLVEGATEPPLEATREALADEIRRFAAGRTLVELSRSGQRSSRSCRPLSANAAPDAASR